jgi:hypothetical protein
MHSFTLWSLCSGERAPGIYCVGRCVSPRACLDAVEKRIVSCLFQKSSPHSSVIQSVIRRHVQVFTSSFIAAQISACFQELLPRNFVSVLGKVGKYGLVCSCLLINWSCEGIQSTKSLLLSLYQYVQFCIVETVNCLSSRWHTYMYLSFDVCP